MYMVDHHNYLRKAEHLGSSLAVLAGPLRHIGHGRVLGIKFDRDGNLIMCTAGTVSFSTSASAVWLSLFWTKALKQDAAQKGTQSGAL